MAPRIRLRTTLRLVDGPPISLRAAQRKFPVVTLRCWCDCGRHVAGGLHAGRLWEFRRTQQHYEISPAWIGPQHPHPFFLRDGNHAVSLDGPKIEHASRGIQARIICSGGRRNKHHLRASAVNSQIPDNVAIRSVVVSREREAGSRGRIVEPDANRVGSVWHSSRDHHRPRSVVYSLGRNPLRGRETRDMVALKNDPVAT
jgi:hypothetical protein